MKKQYWIAIVLAVLVVASISFYAFEHWSFDGSAHREDILAFMPSDASSVIFADVAELRRAPFIAELFAWAPKPQTDADYAQFLRDTGFDYERDLDRTAIAVEKHGSDSALFVVVDGRFDIPKIRAYAQKSGTTQKRDGHEIFTVALSGSPRKISFTFLRKDRLALTDDDSLIPLFSGPQKNSAAADWRVRFDRLAGSPVFAVIQQDAATSAALAAQTPGGFRSPQLSALLDQLQWITIAGKPESNDLRVVMEGEAPAEATVRQLTDLLNGVVVLAETGLNDPKTRQQLAPATREAYLELLRSADVSKLDRGETKSVRLVFDLTPKFLQAARTAAPLQQQAPPPPERLKPSKPATRN
jgi:hypothetical protein